MKQNQHSPIVKRRLGARPEIPPIGAGGISQDTVRRTDKLSATHRKVSASITLIAIILLFIISLNIVRADIIIDNQTPSIGVPLHISIQPAIPDQTLTIRTPTTTFRFVGDVPPNATFIPDVAGTYMILVLANDTVVDNASFVVDTPSPVIEPSIVQPELQQIVTPSEPSIQTPPSPITQPSGQRVSVVHADGSPAQESLIWTKDDTVLRQSTTTLFDPASLPFGVYDLQILHNGSSLKSISLRGVRYSGDVPLGVEEVWPQELSGNTPTAVINAFAIDPTRLGFDGGSISFVAVGIALYKCTAYNFTVRSCDGSNDKIMDLSPGTTYTIPFSHTDPLYSQTGYLSNTNFNNNAASWTNASEGANPTTLTWSTVEGTQNGTANVNITGANKNGAGSYYQLFNLTIPTGTNLIGINFSAFWTISAFSANGRVNFTIQDSARTSRYCNISRAFAGATAWAKENMTTGTANCPLGNFSVNTNYTFRMQCFIATGAGGGSVETCKWDNASIIVWYNDTTAPVLRNITDTPDPVNWSSVLNISVNITDNIGVNTTLVEINRTNYTLVKGAGDIYYYDAFDTRLPLGLYSYKVFANDTNGNNITNNSPSLNFTIIDSLAPNVSLMGPDDPTITTNASQRFFYNVSDQVGANNCSLRLDGSIVNSTLSNALAVKLNLSASITEAAHLWNITCNDTSNNVNTSLTRLVVRDNTNPVVLLNITNNTVSGNQTTVLNYTPQDVTLYKCDLWHNFNGSWALNQTVVAPANYSLNSFSAVNVTIDGVYLWNVDCTDNASNHAFNKTNFTYTVDTTPPTWSNIQLLPASGVTYAAGATYRFNITWTDATSGVNSVLLETNVTGSLANVSPQKIGNVYNYTFTNLAAGDYAYRWYANDNAVAQNNKNNTAQTIFTIVKATPVLNITFNGTDADQLINLNDVLNITGNLSSPSSGYIELYIDTVLVINGTNPLSNITQFTQEKRYNFTLYYNATQNYSFAGKTRFVDVLDLTPPSISLSNPSNGSFTTNNVTFFFIPADNVNIANCTIVLDGINNNTNVSTINIANNITINSIPEGLRNWTVNCSDTSNNTAINTTREYFTVDITPPAAFNLSSPASGTISNNLAPTLTWNQTTETNFLNYTIFVDNDINFGSINYQGGTLNAVTNRTIVFSLADQSIWYWKVIAYDKSGNQRTSQQVFNYTADATPPTIDQNTANNTYKNVSMVTLSYTPSDFTAIANCSLSLNGTLNQTNTTITTGATNSFTVTLAERLYNWSVSCFDVAGNQNTTGNFTIIIDLTSPASFPLTGPDNNTITAINTPTYSWSQTTEANFANYTVEVSDVEDFSNINYSLSTSPITNTSVVQSPVLADGVWYWRVVAYDLAGNRLAVHPTLIIDTTPPTVFDLLTPNNTQQRNTTPLFFWQQSTDINFKNYTLLASTASDFSIVNRTNTTTNSSYTNSSLGLTSDSIWYWKVIAYDNASNSRNSTSTFVYVPDFLSPNISQVSPANNSLINVSSLIPFIFNVSDLGDIANCSLFIDTILDRVVTSPSKNVNVTIASNLENGNHSWYVSCQDLAGNVANTTSRNLTVNVSVPIQILYESSPGTTNYSAFQSINLSYTKDTVENHVSFSINPTSVATAVNASILFNGSGLLLKNNTFINFSGVFDQSNPNSLFVTWKLFKVNTTTNLSLCQDGNDNTAGHAIGTATKKTIIGNCTYNAGELRFFTSDNLTLTVDIYNSGGGTRSFNHYWENASDSLVRFAAYKLGTINASFANFTDQQFNETGTYLEQCNITCADGLCLTTDVYLQTFNGTVWKNVTTGTTNSTLNGSQLNPVSIGDINTSTIVNFTLYGSLYSFNNSLRCYADSTYSTNASATKNLSVIDRLPPTVTLTSPANNSAFPSQNITFQFTPIDRRLANCTLWGNWSGAWTANQTNTTPQNGTTNSFAPVFLNYGVYLWNVECYDNASNRAFNLTNFTLNIAGDLEIISGNISFSTNSPVEGQNITLYANVSNKANKTETGVVVQFWDGDPNAGGTQINGNVVASFGRLGSNLTNTTWLALVGTHQIYVAVDPPTTSGGVILESDETNNVANKTLIIGLWQVYYGNVTGSFVLGTSLNKTFVNWTLTNSTGNIYITDTDNTNGIKFAALQAIGRNTTSGRNANTDDDFTDIDTVLNTQSYSDNVNASFTSAGNPIAVSTYLVFTRTIGNVSVVNSSTDGNFTTGILWDTDDSTNSFFDTTNKEDLVFVTKIRKRTQSAYGIEDYEVRVPSNLTRYKGSNPTVSLYYEIQ